MDNLINLESIWEDYGLNQLQTGINDLFPDYSISLSELLTNILEGDITGLLWNLLKAAFGDMGSHFAGMKNVMIWLVVLGITSALMTHFIDMFDKQQIADIGFYFMYLLLSAVLLKCFSQALQITGDTIGDIADFIKLLIPTYLLVVGVASGTTTASAYYQFLLLLIYAVENILVIGVLPFIQSYIMLVIVNGIWVEEKLSMLVELIEKMIRGVLKASIGIVTGISIFQAIITPVIDSVKSSALQKAVSAIPGVGNAADGVVELVIGTAVVIKNSVGIVMLLLLLLLCAAPLLQVFLIAGLMKVAAAFMGIVSDKRITTCTNKIGDGCMLLFRTTATALILFMITISVVAAATNKGF